MKDLFARWNKAGWPVLSVPPELLLAATARKVAEAAASQQAAAIQQVAAKQEWDAEGGATKSAIVPGPKLPL